MPSPEVVDVLEFIGAEENLFYLVVWIAHVCFWGLLTF